MPAPSLNAFKRLRQMMDEVSGLKKDAKARTEGGHYNGQTSHPTKDVDDGTINFSEGARASEHDKDIAQSVPANVNEAAKATDRQVDQQFQIGPRKSESGGDPSVEDDYKDRPKDPGTSHPADTSLGEKYSADKLTSPTALRKAAAELGELANQLLAQVFVTEPQPKHSQPASPTAGEASAVKAGAEIKNPPDPAAVKQAEAGYELAALMGYDKQAAHKVAGSVVEAHIRDAAQAADDVGRNVQAFLAKRAAREDQSGKKKANEGMPPPPEAAMAGAGGGAPPMDPAAMGGAPPMDPAMAGAGGGGAPGKEQLMQEMLMALMEAGVSPEEFVAFLSQGGAPAPESPAGEAVGAVKAAQEFARNGNFEFREAKKGSAERALRDQLKAVVLDLLKTTRQAR